MKINHIALATLFAFGFALPACTGSRSARVMTAKEARTPNRSLHPGAANNHSSSAPLPEYRIGMLDQLEIRFTYHERFNETVTVRPDGRITLEGSGDIFVAGLTPMELDRVVTEAYSKILQTAEVTVFVRSFGGLAIYVLGEVDQPGAFDLKPNLTVLQALALAGGPIRGAKLNSVVLLRRNPEGRLNATRLNLARGAISEAAAEDAQVFPQDVIFVPKTFIANVNEFLTQIYSGILPPLDSYLRVLREYDRR